MKKNIIFISGSACPFNESKIALETTELAQKIEALESGDHKVTVVGNPSRGFTFSEVEAAFRENPGTNIMVVEAHGNIKKKKHYLRTAQEITGGNKGEDVWASQLYKSLAKFSGRTPLNVFMFSCGSGNGCKNAVKLLPRGSTLVNFVAEDEVNSFHIDAQCLNVKSSNCEYLSEQLFLSILCKGLGRHKYYPQISVSAGGEALGNVWSMWDLRADILDEPICDAATEEKVIEYLKNHSSPEKISTALRTIELYIKSLAEGKIEHIGTPVAAHLKIDHEKFLNDIIANSLLGPICAIGYYATRESIGAFQSWPLQRYLKPRSPEGDKFTFNTYLPFLAPTG